METHLRSANRQPSNLEGSRLWKDQRGEGKRNENKQKLQSQRNKEGCRLALRRCVEARCQDVECLSTLSVLCLVVALSDCI